MKFSLRFLLSQSDPDPWIEVDLGDSTVVSGVITQGSHWTDSQSPCRVKKYKVEYQTLSSQTSEFVSVTDTDGSIVVSKHLKFP